MFSAKTNAFLFAALFLLSANSASAGFWGNDTPNYDSHSAWLRCVHGKEDWDGYSTEKAKKLCGPEPEMLRENSYSSCVKAQGEEACMDIPNTQEDCLTFLKERQMGSSYRYIRGPDSNYIPNVYPEELSCQDGHIIYTKKEFN